MKNRLVPATISAIVLCFLAPGLAASPLPPNLDAYVHEVMAAFEVPGLALAVVADGQVVLAKGYGVKRLGETAEVDAHTRFGIASNTKVFTAVALGILVEEGKLEWDAPVVRYLPAFQLWDPWVTREITVRDLLVHRSGLGLGAGDLLWWPPSTYSRDEVMRRLRYLPPATSFRSAYAYDNVLYIVAGQLVEAVSGATWERFVTERILNVVGMGDSNVLHSEAMAGDNVAAPHARVEGTVRPVTPFASDTTNPAGGINSSATDMARWLSVLLAEGTLAGEKRLFSAATWRELGSLVVPIPVREVEPPLELTQPQFLGYGLGLGVRDYRGHKTLTHGGALPGYVSRVTMVPGKKFGLAVLTNQESGDAYLAISYFLVDHALGFPPTDWLAAFREAASKVSSERVEAEAEAVAARPAQPQPSLPLTAYAGTYSDAWYGDVTIALEGEKLVIRFGATPSLVGDLEPWQHDTFIARWRDRELRADAFVSFALDPEGKVEQAKMKAVSPATDFSFDFHDLLLLPVGD